MKKMKTKKILVTLFVIFLALSIVGITNLISYAKNENVNKIAETIQEKTPKISISFDKNIWQASISNICFIVLAIALYII